MPTYRIAPLEVQTVLTTTQTEAEKFGTLLEPLQGLVEDAAAGTNPAAGGTAGASGAIVPALESFFTAQSAGLTAINTRTTAALTGAVNATQAYIDGDMEMITEYQDQAAIDALPYVPGPNDPQ